MFIKKDLRKIPKILEEAVECNNPDNHQNGDNDDDDATMATTIRQPKRSKVDPPLSELRLGRRHQEFQGSIQILCQPSYIPKLQCLQNLNLYDCAIASLDGIGLLSQCPKLEILNLGRNPLTTLPDELSALAGSLKQLWLDDCQLTGPLPDCVAQLVQLESLRVPNNQITSLSEATVSNLTKLKCLVLDRNPLVCDPHVDVDLDPDVDPNVDHSSSSLPSSLPQDWSRLVKLEELHLRHVQLTKLPLRLPSKSLKVLHLSSNPLTEVDGLVTNHEFTELTHLYLNGCQLTRLPEGIVSKHTKLERLVISHNPPLTYAPVDMWHAIRGKEFVTSSAEIVWQPNPQLEEGVTEAPSSSSSSLGAAIGAETDDQEDSSSSSDDDGPHQDAMEGVELTTE